MIWPTPSRLKPGNGWTFIRLPMGRIVDKRKRRGLEARVIRERRSLMERNREIRSRFGRRLRSGRNPYTPKDQAAELSELIRLAMKLTRWGAVMGINPEIGKIDADADTDLLG